MRGEHRLSNIDKRHKKADCAKCGRVDVCLRDSGQGWSTWKCREGMRERERRRRKAKPNHRHGKFFTVLAERDGEHCQICKRSEGVSLIVDHCHKTGEIRGILCSACNSGIGLFRDNPLLMFTAITYLRRFVRYM